jgi:predicted nucleic acid-binding Zn ribbon protein
MAQYRYKCKDCNKDIIVECKMKDYVSEVTCDCGGTAERNVADILPQNYVVKCSGFYGKKSN